MPMLGLSDNNRALLIEALREVIPTREAYERTQRRYTRDSCVLGAWRELLKKLENRESLG